MKLSRVQQRRLLRFEYIAQPVIDFLGLLLILIALLSLLTWELLGNHQATGGDMASHYWTFDLLHKVGLSEFRIKLWNPGNQFGEPRLLHYFPLPFIAMEILSHFISTAKAFNWGTLLGFLLLPSSIYVSLRGFGLKFPAPLLAASASVIFLLNESYSMWGGNALSTMAGQFAHGYGLCFLFLTFGAMAWETRDNRFPFWSIICSSCLLLSHAYPALGVPIFSLVLIGFAPTVAPSRAAGKNCRWQVFYRTTFVAIFSLALTAWFLLPMAANREWMTKFIIAWRSENIWLEAFGAIYYPQLVVLGLALLLVGILVVQEKLKGNRRRQLLLQLIIWFSLSTFFWLLYFILPYLGLIDIRALPQIQLFLCVLTGILLGELLRYYGRLSAILVSLPLVMAVIAWSDSQVKELPKWAEWNYSGWNAKELYPEFVAINEKLKGNFSDPRVVFELSVAHRQAGTIRAFEMLPYFAERSTLESVYLEATHLAPASVYMQAEVSRQPSCPLSQFPCPQYNIAKSLPRLRLMGVGELILVTREVLKQANSVTDLEAQGVFGPWHLYRLIEQPQLVEVMREKPQGITEKNWQEQFYQWFLDYAEGDQMLLVGDPEKFPEQVWQDIVDCRPLIVVEVNRISLNTNCPGRAHLLKFGYHPAWRSSTGENIFNISPGFMLVVPRGEKLELVFGPTVLWQTTNWVFLAAVLSLPISWVYWAKKFIPVAV